MKKSILFFAGVGLLLMASCNKDQAAVGDLKGTWLEKKINNVDIPFENASEITFDKCKLSKDEYCTVTTKYAGDSTDVNEYKIIEDGTILVLREPGSTFELQSTITEVTKEKLILTTTLFGVTTTQEYDKR